MIALGVFILVFVALASLAVAFRGGEIVHIDLHWFTIKASAGIVFLAGAVALTLAALGLSLLWEGLKRARKRRKETKELRHRAEASEQTVTSSNGPGSTQASTSTSSTSTPPPSTPASAPPPTIGTQSSGPDDHFDTTPRER